MKSEFLHHAGAIFIALVRLRTSHRCGANFHSTPVLQVMPYCVVTEIIDYYSQLLALANY